VTSASDSLLRLLRWGPPIVAALGTAALWLLVDRWWVALPLGYGPRWPWLVLPLLPLLAGGGWRRWLPATILTTGIVLWGLLGFRLGALSRPPAGGSGIRLVTANVAVKPDALRQLLDAAVTWSADLVVAVECPARDAPSQPGYQLAARGELCVWSRSEGPPVITDAPRDVDAIGWSGTIALVSLPGSGLASIGVVHLRSVRNELSEFLNLSAVLSRRDSLEARHSKRIAGSRHASDWFRSRAEIPELVVGDFNLVVESPRFRADWHWWQDAFESIGSGTGHTWSSRWYGLRIDHVLSREPWRPTSIRRGPLTSSDHRALFVELVRR
jgi:hypothetical protein